MHEKVFVQVLVLFDEAGTMTPKSIRWEDGRVFSIDRILDIRPAASLKAGGLVCGAAGASRSGTAFHPLQPQRAVVTFVLALPGRDAAFWPGD